MLTNIPQELKKLQQWVCFDVSPDGRKIPYTPGTDSMAASNRPRDWRSFRAACADVEEGKRQHVGFAFSSSDPYVFIDLDDPGDEEQVAVFKRIHTYSQRSVSGEGCHLICKGTFKGSGKHPEKPQAGIFKEARFCLMTGDVVAGRNQIEEVDEEILQSIHSWLGGGTHDSDASVEDLVEYEQDTPDQTVFEMGCDRYVKFESLCRGDWEKYEEFHNDHSTADHAFISMLCDLTECNEQVRWFFANSGMWNEARAAKKAGHGFEGYVNRTIAKTRAGQARVARQMASVTLRFEEEPEVVETEVVAPVMKKKKVSVNEIGARDLIDRLPAGLLRDIAEYSHASAYLPLQEASITAALSFLSGTISRGYISPSGTGLNLWLVLVGKTGCGKDELQKCFKRLLGGVSKTVPHFRRVFGGEVVSGAGLETAFQETLRYVSYFKEFGKTYGTLVSSNQQEHTRTLVGALLNSYNSADLYGSLEGRKKAKNEGEKPFILRPSLTIMGDSTPGELYDSMTTRELGSGFLQRFMLINVKQESWSARANPSAGSPPPRKLIEQLTQLVEAMERFDASPEAKPHRVQASPAAAAMLDRYTYGKRQAIMGSKAERPEDEINNRAGLKVMRLATIAAVSADWHSPLIEEEHVAWAIEFVEWLDGEMLKKFSSGEVGSSQVKQEAVILKQAKIIAGWSETTRKQKGMSEKTAKLTYLIPFSHLKELCVNNAAFAVDRLGAVTAFEKCVDSMVKSGVFSKLEANFAVDNYDHMGGILLCLQ